MKMGLTEIIIVLDRSGSMTSIREAMQNGVMQFLQEQALVPGELRMTLVQFDTPAGKPDIETVFENVPAGVVSGFTFTPRGGTPLLDAVGTTITRVGERYAQTAEGERPQYVILLIVTDGEENASHEYTKAQIKAMIEHQTATYNWQFSFLGANVDAFAEARSMGIAAAASSNYQANEQGVASVFRGASAASASYRGGGGFAMPTDQQAP